MSLPYRIIVGLETHVELATATKMFCRCANDPFGSEPNTNICPVCLGMPGTLPVPNREAIRHSILVGKALGSTIAEYSKWDRKHYFYPDNPKGYQISQYDMPLCIGGQVELLDAKGEMESVVRFERIHLEEDAGKLQHAADGISHVDLNRAGVPLIEMVSLPDLTSPEQARRFLQELRLLVRRLGVSDADMEKGQMRCDVNINIAFEHGGETVKTPITEVKNVNSTRAVERSITTEAQRQYDEWMAGGPITTRKNKLTAGWDEGTNTVKIQRAKEAANDYRYFPEPDIPPIAVYKLEDLHPDTVAANLPELPNALRRRLLAAGIESAVLESILAEPEDLEYLLEYVDTRGLPAKVVGNWLKQIPEAFRHLQADQLVATVGLVQAGDVSFSALKEKWAPFMSSLGQGMPGEKSASEQVREAAEANGLLQSHDEGVVQSLIEQVFAANPQAVADYKSGNVRILGFLVGQVMKAAAGKAQPAKVQEAVQNALTKIE